MLKQSGRVTNMTVTNQTLFRVMTDLSHTFAYGTTMTLTGVNIKYRGDDCMMIVKARTQGGDDMVAFITAPTDMDCWRYLAAHLTVRNAPLKFRPDRYAKLQV